MPRPPSPFDLTGKVALVTGANHGLGLGFATGIAKAGGDVVIWGRRAEQNEEAAQELRGYGGRVFAQAVDVADEEQVARGMREAVAELGRLDCVVANAGIQIRQPSFLEVSTEVWDKVLGINLSGAFFTLREAVRHMLERGEAGDPGGSLITCGSLSVVSGVPRIQPYAASKGGLAALTRSIAVEYGAQGIRCNMILPGRIESDLGGTKTDEERQATRDMMAERNPIPRNGYPSDLEGIAVYLMSDASSYHTGDMITIDGGLAVSL